MLLYTHSHAMALSLTPLSLTAAFFFFLLTPQMESGAARVFLTFSTG